MRRKLCQEDWLKFIKNKQKLDARGNDSLSLPNTVHILIKEINSLLRLQFESMFHYDTYVWVRPANFAN